MVYERQAGDDAPNLSRTAISLVRNAQLGANSANTWTGSLFGRFLRASTDYVFVLTCTQGCGGNNAAHFRLTDRANEDGEAGWTLANRVQQTIHSVWQTHSKKHALVMEIRGEEAQRPWIEEVSVVSVPKATARQDTYAAGEKIVISTRFSEAMQVTGTPGFRFKLGGASRTAWYTGGDTSGNLTFSYTVAKTDVDRNGIEIGDSHQTWTAVQTFASAATGNRAQLEHEALGTLATHKVDGNIDRPEINALTLLSAPLVAPTYGRGETIELTATFDRAVSVSGTPQARMEIGTTIRKASYTRGAGTDTLHFEYTVRHDDNDGNGIRIPADALAPDETDGGGLIWDTATSAVADTTSEAVQDRPEHRVNGQFNRQGQSSLRILALRGLTLTPAFVSRVHSYTATTPSGTEVTVVARASIQQATVEIDPEDANPDKTGDQVALIGGGTRAITVTVTAINEGTTSYTIDVAHTGVVPEKPDPPSVRVGTKAATATASWTPPSDFGNPVTSYDVRWRQVGTQSWGERTLDTPDTTTTLTGLEPDGHYEVQVRAANFIGTGPWSESGTVELSPPPPDAPEAPSVATASLTSLELTWNAPEDYGQDIKDYHVRFQIAAQPGWTRASHAIGPRGRTTLTGLRSGTSYEAQVRAVSASGAGPWSPSGTGETATEPCAERVGDDWCTTLTVATRTTGAGTATGAHTNEFGSIADPTIRHAGNAWTVEGIWLWQGQERTVNVQHEGAASPPGSTFNLGGATFVNGIASQHPTVAHRHTWAWPQGLEWHDGQKKTVSARVQRASDDATLQALSLRTGDGHAITLQPAFDPARRAYTAYAAHSVEMITVETKTAYLGADVEHRDGDGEALTDAHDDPGFQQALVTGENRLQIRVTAGDGATTTTYPVAVTRSEAPIGSGTPRALRLADDEGEVQYGSEEAQGRLEFFHRGRWGTVCKDRFESTYGNDAPLVGTNIVPRNFAPALACKQLGYANGEYAPGWGQPGRPHTRQGANESPHDWQPIWLDDVRCSVGSTHSSGTTRSESMSATFRASAPTPTIATTPKTQAYDASGDAPQRRSRA